MFYRLRVMVNDLPHLGASYVLSTEETVKIGRTNEANVIIPLPEISSLHAMIFYDAETKNLKIKDLESKQGTFVNSRKMLRDDVYVLNDRDFIQIGRAFLKIEGFGADFENSPITFPTGAVGVSPTSSPVKNVDYATGESNLLETAASSPSDSTSATSKSLWDTLSPEEIVENQSQQKFKKEKGNADEGEIPPPPQQYHMLTREIRDKLIQRVDLAKIVSLAPDDQQLRENICRQISYIINELLKQNRISEAERPLLQKEAVDNILGFGPIQDLLDNREVSEIMVNRPNEVYYEKSGKIILSDSRFQDEDHVQLVLQRLLRHAHRRADLANPIVNASLADGSRLNAVLPPISLKGTTITIRKFHHNLALDDLIYNGTMNQNISNFLKLAVEKRQNIIVSGGTGSGKTTLLNVLSSFIPNSHRVITIEDTAELSFRQPHVIRLQGRPANIEGRGLITIRDLVVEALRMRPDRIIVGECRHGEALDMLQAMNTGHDGSLTTVHANNSLDALRRLEIMVLLAGIDIPLKAIREQIRTAVNIIVHQERLIDGSRRITEIHEITGLEGDDITTQPIFEFRKEGMTTEGKIIGKHIPTGYLPTFLKRMKDQGESPPNLFDIR